MTVHELGICKQVELVDIQLQKGEQKSPTYLAMNPNGRVPTLDDDGFILWESQAIMQYLCEGVPGQTLFPTERRARADVTRWMFWHAHHLSGAVGTLNRERFVKKMIGGEPDPAEIAKAEALVRQLGAVLDQHLAGREWICGDRFTLADIAIGAELATKQAAQLPINDFANIEAWFGRVAARDSWRKASS